MVEGGGLPRVPRFRWLRGKKSLVLLCRKDYVVPPEESRLVDVATTLRRLELAQAYGSIRGIG